MSIAYGLKPLNRISCWVGLTLGLGGLAAGALAQPSTVLGDPVDVSRDFADLDNAYYVAGRVLDYDPASGAGTLEWRRSDRQLGLSFGKLDRAFGRAASADFPGTEYDLNPTLPFAITFVSARTIRLRLSTRNVAPTNEPSLMLLGNPPDGRSDWQVSEIEGAVVYRGPHGSLRLQRDPWDIEILDPNGRLVTSTQHQREVNSFAQPVPFSFVRRALDVSRRIAAVFQLSPDEMIFGGGESFTRLNKRGQKIFAYTRDGMGAQTDRMYKPIPFFLSSAGYGMFVHTSAPVTFDFGFSFDQSNAIYSADEFLDLFVFIGSPKEVLSEYTALTGRSPVPPLWSFGLWMSRITYNSEEQVRDVAAQLREHRIPSDVIHLDTGWFETDWRCDYRFSESRFPNPEGMIGDLRDQGFRISLWQLPYFTSKNLLFKELVEDGLVVRNAGGELPAEDAVLDFSNPDAITWYQAKLADLLKLGVGAIKVDFGEEAPLHGVYASGRTGLYEHNLYPLRYNKAAAEITHRTTGERIIWARSAWAGSQRYPLHWSGDAENTYSAMAATLRSGLSFGLSGFTYWSHDAGGFVQRTPRELYRRWLSFAALTSHTRCHGAPPKEPWAYDEAFVEDFRRAVELKYALMPYIYAQSVASSEEGFPVLRPLFFEYPDDPTSWYVEDQYLLGSDLLVAPLMEETNARRVYLPPGGWIDYQTGRRYSGRDWHQIEAGAIPIILLARERSVIPHVRVAQHTGEIDWSRVELRAFTSEGMTDAALFALPQGELVKVTVTASGDEPRVTIDPMAGRVEWEVRVVRGQE
jgi:alpha-D-xyloside xylohydrolase